MVFAAYQDQRHVTNLFNVSRFSRGSRRSLESLFAFLSTISIVSFLSLYPLRKIETKTIKTTYARWKSLKCSTYDIIERFFDNLAFMGARGADAVSALPFTTGYSLVLILEKYLELI